MKKYKPLRKMKDLSKKTSLNLTTKVTKAICTDLDIIKVFKRIKIKDF
ncbi:hypothetical protein PYS58_07775 [Chryseobacterium indologenes]|nr:hypothetical protein [Chryseobacterium indologenes]WET51027.1 hypothetical protein PYS58_07775 [Chryseobacterium indologenes]